MEWVISCIYGLICFLIGCLAGYYLFKPHSHDGILYGKDAKEFYEKFVINTKPDPAKAERNKRDVELFLNTRRDDE